MDNKRFAFIYCNDRPVPERFLMASALNSFWQPWVLLVMTDSSDPLLFQEGVSVKFRLSHHSDGAEKWQNPH